MYFRLKSKSARFGAFIFGMILVATFFGGTLFDKNSDKVPVAEKRLSGPSAAHFFGTDQLGRDVFSRVLSGGRLSLTVSLTVVSLSLIIGLVYGALSAALGGIWDHLLMRIVDMLLSFPLIFLAITCMALFGGGISYLIIVLALTSWMDVARLVRAEVLTLKQRPFVLRAKAAGLGSWTTLFRHIVPHVFVTISAFAIIRMADIILIESSLSFIGLGVQPPQASWGGILNDGWPVLSSAWWMSFFPGIAIVLSITSLNLIGNALKSRWEAD